MRSVRSINLTWMVLRDFDDVMAIDRVGSDHPLSESQLKRVMRQQHVVGYIAKLDNVVVGFVVYELHHTRLRLIKLVVHPEHTGCGVGTELLARVLRKLSARRILASMEVRERNLRGQIFLRSSGFRATEVLREHFSDTGEDAYAFEYRLRDRLNDNGCDVVSVGEVS